MGAILGKNETKDISKRNKKYKNKIKDRFAEFESIPYYTRSDGKKLMEIHKEIMSPCHVIHDLDIKVIFDNQITITIDYPLENPFKKEYTYPDGFTRRQIMMLIYNVYTRIYEEESKTSTIPEGFGRNGINRNSTNGQYGIWGYSMYQMALFDILYNKKTHELCVIINTARIWLETEENYLVQVPSKICYQ